MHRISPRRLLVAIAALLPALAMAHPGQCGHGFVSGIAHPFTGIDHLLAMAAVGWWSAVTQERRWWTVPLAFAGCTLFGALIGFNGLLPLPASETMIALSLVVLGVLLIGKLRLSTAAACGIAGTFGLFHGYSHGVEMPVCGMGNEWLTGMVVATALLHLGGALAGKLAARYADWATRLAGSVTALTGAALLAGVISA
jgi:urease accessory protein